MGIKWSNVVAFALFLLAAVLAIAHQGEIGAALNTIGRIGPGHSVEEQTIGLGVLGVCLAALVAVVRLICDHDRKGR